MKSRPEHPPRRQFRVGLFGSFSLEQIHASGPLPISVSSRKAQSLLAYLLLQTGRRSQRNALVAALWPEIVEERARRQLSDTLYRLRKVLGADWLRVDGETVMLDPGMHLDVDVWAFEAAIHQGNGVGLSQAVRRYRGELLADLPDEWLYVHRLALHESYLDARLRLAQEAEKSRELALALLHYRHLIQADPLYEAGYVGVMRVLAAQHRHREALHLYAQLDAQLQSALNTTPSAYAQEMAAQLRCEAELLRAEGADYPTLQRMPFVGRVEERATALQTLRTAQQGRGSVLLVEGQAGIGKSRFLVELAESARWRNIWVVHIQAPDMPADAPLSPLAEALAETLTPPRQTQLAAVLPDVTQAALAMLVPAWSTRAELPILPPEQNRTRFLASWLSLVQAMTEYAPCLFLCDDMHRAQTSLWETLGHLTSHLRDLPVLLVVAFQRAALQEHAIDWALLQEWDQRTPMRRIVLDPLPVEDVARLVAPTPELDPVLVHRLTGGNPFYVEQTIQAGALAADALLQARFQRLTAPERDALHVAAILGERTPFGLWRDLLYWSNARLAAVADALVATGLMQADAHGYAFAHERIRQTAVQALDAGQRRQLHSRAAALLAEQDPEDHFLPRAYHLDRAGAGEEAANLYRAAAQHAQAQQNFPEAAQALECALNLLPTTQTQERADTLLALAQVSDVLGRHERQRVVLQEALKLAGALAKPALEAAIHIRLGQWELRSGAAQTAETHLLRARQQAETHNLTGLSLEASLLLAEVHQRVSQHARAEEELSAVLAEARRLGFVKEEARALDGLAWSRSQQDGKTEEAFALYEEALVLQQAVDDRVAVARTLLNMLSGYANIGRWDRVLALTDAVLAAQEEAYYPLGLAVAHQSLAMAHAGLGDYGRAQEHAQAARSGFVAVGETAGAAIASDALGVIAWRNGDPLAGQDFLQDALRQAQALDAPAFQAYALQDLGFLLLDQGDAAGAATHLDQARSLWAKLDDRLNQVKCEAGLGLCRLAQDDEKAARRLAAGALAAVRTALPGGEEPQIACWTLAQLCRALGHERAAARLIRFAYEELMRQARSIESHDMRARFLRDVTANRQIVAAHDLLTGVVRTQEIDLAALRPAPGQTDRVHVCWTLRAPEDEVIDDPRSRRSLVLRRLLQEAAAQGAAPTDQELARALGVSRRTILRDKAAFTLAQSPANHNTAG